MVMEEVREHTANRHRAKQQAWLFHIALWGPCVLWFSYVFVVDMVENYFGFVFVAHIVWIVLSVIFCAVWSATKGLRKKILWLEFFGFLILYTIAQAIMHVVVTYLGCIPVMGIM